MKCCELGSNTGLGIKFEGDFVSWGVKPGWGLNLKGMFLNDNAPPR